MAAPQVTFSIVTPTRNRAASLGHALRSALAQTVDDFEIVVSNNHSSDATDDVVRQFDDPRIRYVRTDRDLSMADHWEFALGKATGDWVLFLCDDDALLPDCLDSLGKAAAHDGALEVLQYAAIQYVYDDGIESRGNYIRYQLPARAPYEAVDSARHLESAFDAMSGDMPKFLNAAVRRDLVERLRARHGRVFRPWAPDYSAGMALLAHTTRFGRLNRPLLMWGKNVRSYGSGSYVDPGHLLKFLREFREFDGRLALSPYPDLISVHNVVYDTLLRTRESLGSPARHLSVDPRTFLEHLLRDIAVYIKNGHEAYRRHQETVERDLRRLARPLAARYRRGARRLLKNARRIYAKLSGARKKDEIIPGDRGGAEFSNIYEAAQCFWRHYG